MNDDRSAEPRQHVQKHGGRGRRARLTPVAGTDTSPESPVERDEPAAGSGPAGPNDERLKRDRPPHW
ncbi:MAG: hypothetical protein ABWX82_02125 [Leifsonia sp.]